MSSDFANMDKRVADIGLDGPRPRKKIAVTKTRNAGTIALVKLNADASPLLKLPAELRKKIFTYVIGDQLIHIRGYKRWDRPFLQHAICTADTSEAMAYEESIIGYSQIPKGEDPAYYVENFGSRHEACMPRSEEAYYHNSFKYSRKDRPKEKIPTMDLSLLSVSRQAYEEANQILWTTNTFCIDSPSAFKGFVTSLNFAQKNKMAKLHIAMRLANQSENHTVRDKWDKAINDRLIQKLRGLKSLDVCLELEVLACDWDSCDDPLLAPLLSFQQLPLEKARVIVSDRQKSLWSFLWWLLAHPASSIHGRREFVTGDEVRFTRIKKRAFACHYETRLLSNAGIIDVSAEVNRKLELERQARETMSLTEGQKESNKEDAPTNAVTQGEDGTEENRHEIKSEDKTQDGYTTKNHDRVEHGKNGLEDGTASD
ncbi:MAG: hypothetical protein Q9201_005876 [Fulgogasparrea decipioides]